MKTKVKKIDIGATKKQKRRSVLPALLFIVVPCAAGYQTWDAAVGLEVKEIDRES